jgi:hypothetical protein
MTTAATDTNPLGMSDEDFLNQPLPGSTEQAAEVVQEVVNDKAGEVVENNTEVSGADAKVDPASTQVEDASDVADKPQTPGKQGTNGGNVSANAEVKQDSKTDAATASDPATKSTDAAGKDAQGKDKADTSAEAKPAAQTAAADYESFYKRVMAPFKANGKMIELRSVDEAIQLMQMGANYTRKMQDIQPHRKTLLMLENNQLTDPDQLSFLIDVKNGDPKAIQKLLKDKGIDPMSIDTTEDSNYLGGNHKVSDEEANFRSTLSDLSSHDEGKATLQVVNSTWDQASKEVLWKDPGILQAMHQQRENGIYDRISTEVNRLKTLGVIPADLPFIQAYKAVGDELQKVGAFNDLVTPAAKTPSFSGSGDAGTPAAKEPVATRVVAPKPAVTNGDQASAAAATRSTPREVKKFVNPLAMSDDEFLQQMKNRV